MVVDGALYPPGAETGFYLEKGIQDTEALCKGFQGYSPDKFKIVVVGNGISGILRPSQRVIMSHLCQIRGGGRGMEEGGGGRGEGSTKPPEPPLPSLDPPNASSIIAGYKS